MPDRFCINCKYKVNQHGFACSHPNIPTNQVDLVTGDIINAECRLLRKQFGFCGREGKLFEERTDFIYKISKLFRRINLC